MLNGKEKSRVLMGFIEERATNVLSLLTEDNAKLLTQSIDDIPDASDDDKHQLVQEVVDKIEAILSQRGIGFNDDSLGFDNLDETPFDDGLNLDEPEFEEAAPAPSLEPDTRLKNIPEIGAILSKQRPQIAAFVLSKVEDDIRSELRSHMTDAAVKAVDEQEIEDVPIAEKVFSNLFEDLQKMAASSYLNNEVSEQLTLDIPKGDDDSVDDMEAVAEADTDNILTGAADAFRV